MNTPEITQKLLANVFGVRKGQLYIKDGILKSAFYTKTNHQMSNEEKVSIIAECLVKTINNYDEPIDWIDAVNNPKNKAWEHIQKRAQINARYMIQRDDNNIIRYTENGERKYFKKVDGMTPKEAEMFEQGQIEADDLKEKMKSSEKFLWFKANEQTILSNKQQQLFKNLALSGYCPPNSDKNWTIRYEELTGGKRGRGTYKQIKLMSWKIISEWVQYKESQEREKEFVQMLDAFLFLDEPDMVYFLTSLIGEDENIDNLLSEGLTVSEQIELNKAANGEGFMSRPLLYRVSDVFANYIDSYQEQRETHTETAPEEETA